MAKKRKETSTSSRPRTRSRAAKERHDEREVESTQRLDKLPKEGWEKILDELDENDLFPLALSCRYFRQKQKELVARTRQSEPRFALKTTLPTWGKPPLQGQPQSADYLRFCSKEKVPHRPSHCMGHKEIVRCLAAHHGHLPLLQELLESSRRLDFTITGSAGQYFFPQCLLLCFGF